MCLMCIEIAKGRMTLDEAKRALPEMIETTQSEKERQHYQEMSEASEEELSEIAQKNS